MISMPWIRLYISQLISACIFSLLLTSCSGKHPVSGTGSQKIIPADTTSFTYKKPPSGYNDTLIITQKAAVFYNSDSLQLERIKAITSKMIFENDVHDCYYQMRNARVVLKTYWPQVHIIEPSKVRYLLFISQDHPPICIDIDSRNEMCGIYLYEPGKDPQFIDMTNIDSELGFYFSR